jgi:hypothetical protein
MTDTAYSLPVRETLNTAWEKVKGAKGAFWAVLSVVFAVEFVLGVFTGVWQSPGAVMPLWLNVLSLAVWIFAVIVGWGLVYMGIQRAAGQPIQYRMVGYAFNWNLFFRMVGVYILQVLILIGISSLLVLSYYLASGTSDVSAVASIIVYAIWVVAFFHVLFRMYFSKGLIIAKQMGPLTAIKASFAITKGNVWRLIGVTSCAILVLMVSAIPFGIGLIWSLPFMFINYGEVFKRLVTTR